MAVFDLTESNLPRLPSEIERPTYNRAAVRAGVVHIGVGGFHRAHLAMYLDRLLTGGGAGDWGVCGVGLMEQDLAMRNVLRAQDGLYTLLLKHSDGGRTARVIGSIIQYLYAPDNPFAVADKIASADTHIVSLTITEGGYNFHPDTLVFNFDDPVVQSDLQPASSPRSVFGVLTEALHRRRTHGGSPLTVLSCDNIAENGNVARQMLLAFAERKDPATGAWIARHVVFPNSMVDRITPATTEADRQEIRSRFGIDDGWPVVCEPFVQWVVEDRFSARRPKLEAVGVQLVADVAPYEMMKLRLLNAGHQALAYFGYLCGYRFIHETMRDPAFVRYLTGFMDEEATPTLAPLPGIDLGDYKRSLRERFANAEIRDSLARICAYTSDRIPKFILPVVWDQLRAGGPVKRCAAVVASWARYAEGIDDQGGQIAVVDRRQRELMSIAANNCRAPDVFIENRALFGDLADQPRFVAAYRQALDLLHSHGARATVEICC